MVVELKYGRTMGNTYLMFPVDYCSLTQPSAHQRRGIIRFRILFLTCHCSCCRPELYSYQFYYRVKHTKFVTVILFDQLAIPVTLASLESGRIREIRQRPPTRRRPSTSCICFCWDTACYPARLSTGFTALTPKA